MLFVNLFWIHENSNLKTNHNSCIEHLNVLANQRNDTPLYFHTRVYKAKIKALIITRYFHQNLGELKTVNLEKLSAII